MDIESWGKSVLNSLLRGDAAALRVRSKSPYKKLIHAFNEFAPPGVPIYELEWDVLVVLDACRADLIQEVADEYDILGGNGTIRSVASVTRRWMLLNFVAEYAEEMSETTYICGNPYSESMLEAASFAELREVWRDRWVEPGTVPPEAITNEAISAGRSGYDRMIVHYMQPHCPFISAPSLSDSKRLNEFGNQSGDDVWTRLEKGYVDYEAVWNSYRDNLRLGLDEVCVLLENIDADNVLITSDHGNALGEWGLYGHPERMPFDVLRRVPYYRTSGTDRRTRVGSDVDVDVESTEEHPSAERRLRSLGYT